MHSLSSTHVFVAYSFHFLTLPRMSASDHATGLMQLTGWLYQIPSKWVDQVLILPKDT